MLQETHRGPISLRYREDKRRFQRKLANFPSRPVYVTCPLVTVLELNNPEG